MKDAMDLYHWDPDDGPLDVDITGTSDMQAGWLAAGQPRPIPNDVVKYVTFGKDAMPVWYTDLHDVYLYNDHATSTQLRHTPLAEHPVAARSFMTFPTLSSMHVDFQDKRSRIPYNPNAGVTVWDVMRCMHAE